MTQSVASNLVGGSVVVGACGAGGESPHYPHPRPLPTRGRGGARLTGGALAQATRRGVLAATLAAFAALHALAPLPASAADKPKEIRVDWATYNPVSMLLKERGTL